MAKSQTANPRRKASAPKQETTTAVAVAAVPIITIGEIVRLWDLARTEWAEADTAVTEANAVLEGLSTEDAGDTRVLAAKIVLEQANARLALAEARITELTAMGVPAQNTTPKEGHQEGGTGNAAGPAADRRFQEKAEARSQFVAMFEDAQRLVGEGNRDIALTLLQGARADLDFLLALAAEFGPALDAEIGALAPPAADLVAGAVTVTAKAPSRWRIGRQFTREATPFRPGELTTDQLTALQADPLLDVVVTE